MVIMSNAVESIAQEPAKIIRDPGDVIAVPDLRPLGVVPDDASKSKVFRARSQLIGATMVAVSSILPGGAVGPTKLSESPNLINSSVAQGISNTVLIPTADVFDGTGAVELTQLKPVITPPIQEKLEFMNPYKLAVDELSQRNIEQIEHTYGFKLSTNLIAPGELDYTGLSVDDPYNRFVIADNILKQLSVQPSSITKQLTSKTIYVAKSYDFWSAKVDVAGSFSTKIMLDSYVAMKATNPTLAHEIWHAIMYIVGDEKMTSQLEEIYGDCKPYLDDVLLIDQPTECYNDSFARNYGKTNPFEDLATVAEALFDPAQRDELISRSNDVTPEGVILAKKIQLIRDAYKTVSEGQVDDEYWEALEDQLSRLTVVNDVYDFIGRDLNINSAYIRALFPDLNSIVMIPNIEGVQSEQVMQMFVQQVFVDIKQKLPVHIADFLIDHYTSQDGQADLSMLSDLLKLLSSDLSRLDTHLIAKFDEFNHFPLGDRLYKLLTVDQDFFDLLKADIINAQESDFFMVLSQVPVFYDFLSFYEHYKYHQGFSKQEFYIQVKKASALLDTGKPIKNIDSYGYWLVATGNIAPDELWPILSTPAGFALFSGILTRELPGLTPQDGFDELMRTYSWWRSIYPDAPPEDFIKFFDNVGSRGIDVSYLYNARFLFNHVQVSYPQDEWVTKVRELKTVNGQIDQVFFYDWENDRIINPLAKVTAWRYADAKLDIFIKDFIEQLAKNPDVKVSAKSISVISDTGMYKMTPYDAEFRSLIIDFLSHSAWHQVGSSLDSLSEILENSQFEEASKLEIIDLLRDLKNSPNPLLNFLAFELRLQYADEQLQNELADIIQAVSTVEHISIFDILDLKPHLRTIADILQTTEDLSIRQSLVESIKQLALFDDSRGVDFIFGEILNELDLSTVQNIQTLAINLRARVLMCQIFENNGMPWQDALSYTFRGQISNQDQSQDQDYQGWNNSEFFKLDPNKASPFDAIFEYNLYLQFGWELRNGYRQVEDVNAIRDLYHRLSDSGEYPSFVIERLFYNIRDVFENQPEFEGLLSPNQDIRKASYQAVSQRLHYWYFAETEQKQIAYDNRNTLKALMLDPDSTAKEIRDVIGQIAKYPFDQQASTSDSNSYSLDEYELWAIMLDNLFTQVYGEQVNYLDPKVDQLIKMMGYYLSGFFSSEYSGSVNWEVQLYIAGLIIDEVDQRIPLLDPVDDIRKYWPNFFSTNYQPLRQLMLTDDTRQIGWDWDKIGDIADIFYSRGYFEGKPIRKLTIPDLIKIYDELTVGEIGETGHG